MHTKPSFSHMMLHSMVWAVLDSAHTLKEMVKRYVKTEKALLALVFACFKFYNYKYGKPVIVGTDHQPLISILKQASPHSTSMLTTNDAQVPQVQPHTW